jgi:hypothetical protein
MDPHLGVARVVRVFSGCRNCSGSPLSYPTNGGMAMSGYITKRDLIRHPVLMYRICGLKGLWLVLTAGANVPFLTIVARRLM